MKTAHMVGGGLVFVAVRWCERLISRVPLLLLRQGLYQLSLVRFDLNRFLSLRSFLTLVLEHLCLDFEASLIVFDRLSPALCHIGK